MWLLCLDAFDALYLQIPNLYRYYKYRLTLGCKKFLFPYVFLLCFNMANKQCSMLVIIVFS